MPNIITDQLREALHSFATVPPFADYVDASQLLVVGTRGRQGPRGRRAACHFTRFRESGERRSADGVWELPEVHFRGRPIRYVIAFVLPRFLFLSPREQAEDIVHELLHIDPSFSGVASGLRHGRSYDAAVRTIARGAEALGRRLERLCSEGETVLFQRFRPFPRPYRIRDAGAQRAFDERDLELAALHLDPADRAPPVPRFLYGCPECGETYPRQRPLRLASCGRCAPGYDGRFRLRLVQRAAETRGPLGPCSATS